MLFFYFFFFSSRRRHTRWTGDWSSDVCSSDLGHMTEVRLKRMQACAVAFADEAGKRLAALMRVQMPRLALVVRQAEDRKSTRLNSSHPSISYAVFCLKKKKIQARAASTDCDPR